MDKYDEFAKKIGLNNDQYSAVKKYILDLMIENLKEMKDEYNNEIETVIEDLKANNQ